MKHAKGCACSFCVPELASGCFSPGFCKPCGVKPAAAGPKKRGAKRSPRKK